MATTRAALFALDASGTIGKTLTFARWKGRQYARMWAKPANPQSVGQTAVRSLMAWITTDWTNLSDGAKADWEELATADQITPLNAHVRDTGNRSQDNLCPRQNTTDTPLDTIEPATLGTPVAGAGKLTVSITPHVTDPGDYCRVFLASTTTIAAFNTGIIRKIVDVNATEAVLTGLTPGTLHYVREVDVDTSGQNSALSTQVSGTPT